MPHFVKSHRAWALLACTLAAMLISSASAQAYNRRRSNHSHSYSAVRARQQQSALHAAQAQKAAAEQVLKAAQSTESGAQSRLESALSKLRQEAAKFHDAQSTTRQAAKELAEIEQEILDEQQPDSPYAQAVKRMEAARQKMNQVEDRILSEPATQSKLAGLSGNHLVEAKEAILQVREEYLVPKADFTSEASGVARLRSDLFKADQHWQDAAESLTQARKLEQEAEEHTHAGASGRVGLNLKAKNAAEAATAARAAIAQADAVIKANNGARNNPPGKNNGPPGKGKPPNKKK